MGICDKNALGTGSNSLIHVIWQEQGPWEARRFLNSTQKVVNNWLLSDGHSVGIGDAIPDDITKEKIKETINKSKEEVAKIIQNAQAGKLERKPGSTFVESFEKEVNKALNSACDNAGKRAVGSLDEHNRFKRMVLAGSKGKTLNIAQVSACVGQQNVEGKRIPYGFRVSFDADLQLIYGFTE